MFRRISEDVANDAHRRLRGVDEGVADHELFEDVVLDGALEEVLLHTLFFRCSYVPGSWTNRRGNARRRSVPNSMWDSVMSKRANNVALNSFLSIPSITPRNFFGVNIETFSVSSTNLRKDVVLSSGEEVQSIYSGVQELDPNAGL